MAWDGIERRQPVTEGRHEHEAPRPASSIPVTADEIVTTVVEKAATKVAEAAQGNGHTPKPSALSRQETWVVVAILCVLNIASLFVALGNSRELNQHQGDFQVLCQVIIDLTPKDSPTRAPINRLAECFD